MESFRLLGIKKGKREREKWLNFVQNVENR